MRLSQVKQPIVLVFMGVSGCGKTTVAAVLSGRLACRFEEGDRSLSQFTSDHGVNDDKVRSFELYRNSLVGIEIGSVDELYLRSRFIVEMASPKDANDPVA